MPMTIRDAHPADLPAILAIYNHAVLHSTATAEEMPHTLDQRAAWFDARTAAGFPILVAEIGDQAQIAGWASLGPYHDRSAYRYTAENSVYVAENRRGEGVGTALMAELIHRAASMPLHVIIAAIAGDNPASVRLHAAAGFQQCGFIPQAMRKFNQWVDLIYMVKPLEYSTLR